MSQPVRQIGRSAECEHSTGPLIVPPCANAIRLLRFAAAREERPLSRTGNSSAEADVMKPGTRLPSGGPAFSLREMQNPTFVALHPGGAKPPASRLTRKKRMNSGFDRAHFCAVVLSSAVTEQIAIPATWSTARVETPLSQPGRRLAEADSKTLDTRVRDVLLPRMRVRMWNAAVRDERPFSRTGKEFGGSGCENFGARLQSGGPNFSFREMQYPTFCGSASGMCEASSGSVNPPTKRRNQSRLNILWMLQAAFLR